MTKRYLGNIITQNPTAPVGDLANSAAKGVWSLEEQLAYQKAGLWPVAGNFPPDVEDVFSTYLYDGTNDDGPNFAQTIANGIDLSGEGGMVWIKARDYSANHALVDTVRGNTKYLESSTASAEKTTSVGITAFNSNGFSLGQDNTWQFNTNNAYVSEYSSWTFRKAPKFFDVVTWTGDGVAGRTVSHNLGSAPGVIITKRTDANSGWYVYHTSLGATKNLQLSATLDARTRTQIWNDTAPTDLHFSVGTDSDVNLSGGEYVAYLFAHNDGDGGFGADGGDIIKCGSYTGNGSSAGPEIDLGFEPQWLLVKDATSANDWFVWDIMRGLPNKVANSSASLNPNKIDVEFKEYGTGPTPTGFQIQDNNAAINTSGNTYIYMAIRRGTKVPDSATEVFAVDDRTGASGNLGGYRSGFPVDMAFHKVVTSNTNPYEIGSRLTQGKSMNANDSSAEVTQGDQQYDYMDGWNNETNSSTTKYSWMWKRAPGYFDAVAYTGTGSATNVSHNLGVAPEMIWVKSRGNSENWYVYHKDLGNGSILILNTNSSVFNGMSNVWNNTSPTSSVFTVATNGIVNLSGDIFVAYLFASLPGISKLGSFSHTNGAGDTNVDCGFSSGARFVLYKQYDSAGSWYVLDSVRGIVAGNDPALLLNSTAAEDSSYDQIDPLSSGFTIPSSGVGTGDYIFYAIA